jgi:hypothetical protein
MNSNNSNIDNREEAVIEVDLKEEEPYVEVNNSPSKHYINSHKQNDEYINYNDHHKASSTHSQIDDNINEDINKRKLVVTYF